MPLSRIRRKKPKKTKEQKRRDQSAANQRRQLLTQYGVDPVLADHFSALEAAEREIKYGTPDSEEKNGD